MWLVVIFDGGARRYEDWCGREFMCPGLSGVRFVWPHRSSRYIAVTCIIRVSCAGQEDLLQRYVGLTAACVQVEHYCLVSTCLSRVAPRRQVWCGCHLRAMFSPPEHRSRPVPCVVCTCAVCGSLMLSLCHHML